MYIIVPKFVIWDFPKKSIKLKKSHIWMKKINKCNLIPLNFSYFSLYTSYIKYENFSKIE